MVMVAAAELARGNHDVALKLLEAAARHQYQRQSAPGLTLLGQSYERAGRLDDARKAYARALEQDPESHLCGGIRERLARL
jgi:tetratricopeptide (TPR) repeat protein